MSKIFRTQSDGAHSVRLLCFQSEWVVRLDSTSGLPTNREFGRSRITSALIGTDATKNIELDSAPTRVPKRRRADRKTQADSS